MKVDHPPLESEIDGLMGMLLVVVDGAEVLIAGKDHEMATITHNSHLVGIARQFVWMEFFTQRIYSRLGDDLVDQLDPQDRRIFDIFNPLKEKPHGKRSSNRPNHRNEPCLQALSDGRGACYRAGLDLPVGNPR